MNRTVLQQTVKHLPKLRELHVIGCLGVSHVDVLSVTEHTPLLEALALTVMESVSFLFLPSPGRESIDLGIISSFGLVKRYESSCGRYRLASLDRSRLF